MKKVFLVTIFLFLGVGAFAQQTLEFPFQGGKDIMTRFFKDSLIVTPEIKTLKASGTAVFKFTADVNGEIKKLIIYYADDIQLTPPIIEALRKSNRKWIIPSNEKLHDFIIPFHITFTPPATPNAALQKAVYTYQTKRNPVLSFDQVPLDMATLLPAVTVNYTLPQ